jgi:hypothetical protein
VDSLTGGYRVPYDPRPVLARLDTDASQEAWTELWQGLYHQVDIGDASYAAIPELVRLESDRQTTDWDVYALVATIELARDGQRANPPVPRWLQPAYDDSLGVLARLALARLPSTTDPLTAQSMLSVVAIWRGLRVQARLLVELTEDEALELLNEGR